MARYTSLDPKKYIKIRDAAITLFYNQGIDNTSIQQIANEAGIAKGTIYLYYKNRDDLVSYIFNYCFNLHIEASMKDVEVQKSSSDKLKKRVKNILLWNIEFPKESSIARAYYKPVNVVGTENVAFSRSYEINKEFVKTGVEMGEFKQLPLEFLCNVFFSAVEGISTYVKNNKHVLKDEALLEKMIEATVDSIRK